MFDHEWISDLDAATACDVVASAHRDLLEVETRQLVIAAHWIDLHAPADDPDAEESSHVLPGTERTVRVGADGTPEIDEFACVEFAALQDMHPLAGANLLRKVANLRHRHPLLWQRVLHAEVRGWKALEVAKIVGNTEFALSLERARKVDAQTYEWIDTLPWGQFLDLVEARIIACDPKAAEARRKQAEADQFVASGKSNEYGLKTLIIKATAGDVIYFQAMCDRIAQILSLRGDTSPVGARRAKAVGILATPARALALLETATEQQTPAEPDPVDRPGDGAQGAPDLGHRSHPDDLQQGDLHPAQDDSDDPVLETHPCPTCRGDGTVTGDPSAFVGPQRIDPQRIDPRRIDPERLLPKATLYIHLTQESFETGCGVARMEGVGPITVGQAQEFLRHCNVKLTPVLDLADRRPVDGYEFPAGSREAIHLINPRDVFPFAVSASRRKDMDHPVPYLAPDKGGQRGQTNTGNAAPMVRFHHRIKTHGRWGLRQSEPGVYLWRSPHGWFWLVDHAGTHRLTRHLGQVLWDALRQSDVTHAA